jgi:hypothetical protein
VVAFVLSISPDSVSGPALDIAFAVVVGIILVACIVTSVRRRRSRRELEEREDRRAPVEVWGARRAPLPPHRVVATSPASASRRTASGAATAIAERQPRRTYMKEKGPGSCAGAPLVATS